MASGPLVGIKVVEFAAIGPVPFCGMLLSDMGADVVRIDRTTATREGSLAWAPPYDVISRGRRSVVLDLKFASEVETALRLIEKADALIEGFRPGVMERLGLGPDVVATRQPKLIYGRMTGWGQSGPLAQAAGHDLNYIALSGALHAIGRKTEPPPPPLNLVGDYGGGALYLAMGICAALLEASRSGRGQTIDCAMTDGAASLCAGFYGMRAAGAWTDERDANLLDGGAPFYDTYECQDGKWISLASIEPQFYELLLEKTGLASDPDFRRQFDRSAWPMLSSKLAALIKTKSRDEWCRLMEGTDVCFAPVLSWEEAEMHPHNRSREIFVTIAGVPQPNAAPRFSRTPGAVQSPAPAAGAHQQEVFADWQVTPA